VDAMAELNSTPHRQLGTQNATESGHADQGGCCGRAGNNTQPSQLGTRKATESGHADQGGCCGRAKQHTAPPARDKESTRIWTCCLTATGHTWPPAMKQKTTATISYSKLPDSSPESRLVAGDKEPSNTTSGESGQCGDQGWMQWQN
jgi:hypothetical protein